MHINVLGNLYGISNIHLKTYYSLYLPLQRQNIKYPFVTLLVFVSTFAVTKRKQTAHEQHQNTVLAYVVSL